LAVTTCATIFKVVVTFILDKLIAVGVVDITERCMSSVYLFYDPDLESKFKFGTFTALIEIEYI
jgi:arginyl-tRNA--protein-N-Asp/Glu arginylyltransferase